MTDGTTPLVDRRAPVQRIDLDATAWVEVVEGFVADPVALFDTVHSQASWHQQEVLRYERYIPERRLSAFVRADAVAALRHAELHLESRFRVRFEGVAAILYRDGDDFQGLHSDREMRWLDDTLIAIVVVGARRPFVFRPRGASAQVVDRTPPGEGAGDVVLHPGRGDLLVMGGTNQRDWLHGVPRAATTDPRISLTWRWTSRRGRPDTSPGYFEGRQFSDRPRQPGTRIVR